MRTNAAQAYPWMLLYAERERRGGPTAAEALALRLDTQTLLEGKKIVALFKKSEWPKLSHLAARGQNVALKLTGVTMGGRNPLAVLNRRTLGIGESSSIPLEGGGSVRLKCLEIREDSVLVQVQGEGEARWLQFDNSVLAAAKP